MSESCANCRFARFSGEGVSYRIQCHRRSPMVLHIDGHQQGSVYAVWPRMEPEDWCGEYERQNTDQPAQASRESQAGVPPKRNPHPEWEPYGDGAAWYRLLTSEFELAAWPSGEWNVESVDAGVFIGGNAGQGGLEAAQLAAEDALETILINALEHLRKYRGEASNA